MVRALPADATMLIAITPMSTPGQLLSSTRSKADARYGRIQGGADAPRRRADRPKIPEPDVQAKLRLRGGGPGASVRFSQC